MPSRTRASCSFKICSLEVERPGRLVRADVLVFAAGTSSVAVRVLVAGRDALREVGGLSSWALEREERRSSSSEGEVVDRFTSCAPIEPANPRANAAASQNKTGLRHFSVSFIAFCISGRTKSGALSIPGSTSPGHIGGHGPIAKHTQRQCRAGGTSRI